MPRHLLMRLRAPLIAFGGETIDNFGVIRDFPALSMVTGLLANALGWDRGDDGRHNRLQERLVMGARLDDGGKRLVDYQTALLYQDDSGWTTRGIPDIRQKSDVFYTENETPRGIKKAGTLQRYRHYHTDMDALLALRLQAADEAPTLDDLAAALDKPARPLFIGRKNCLPTDRLMAGWVDAENILEALQKALPPVPDNARAQWPEGEGQLSGQHQNHSLDVCDERNWTSGVHGGWRPVLQGVLRAPASHTAQQETA